ncbi:MAG: c-type cytochrome, partial [Acidobacteriota bacterium]
RLTCASSYCHGEQGRGGGGPVLQGRSISFDRLNRVIRAGIPGTAMPGFSDRFGDSELARIVDYVQALSALTVDEGVRGSESAAGVANPEGKDDSDRAAAPVTDLGRSLFFDSVTTDNCRVCHTFQGKGGKVGPDLTGVGSQSEEEILRSILKPSDRIEPGYGTVEITMRDGNRYAGVVRDENDERIRLFDTTTIPPVSRVMLKADIAGRKPLGGSVMPSELGVRLSEVELRALVKFLRGR